MGRLSWVRVPATKRAAFCYQLVPTLLSRQPDFHAPISMGNMKNAEATLVSAERDSAMDKVQESDVSEMLRWPLVTAIPATMRAVQLRAYDGQSFAIAELPVPRPGPGQVLVRVAASPINPSDQMFIRGLYGFRKSLPAIPGFEGSGTVVEAGSGMMARFLKGRRVACAAGDPHVVGGLWAEYLVTSAQLCVPLSKQVDMEQGATMLVNPLTAWALIEEARIG